MAGAPSLTGFMNDYRYSHRATLLPNGQVLVSGGGGDSSSETYDPGSASWINFVNMNEEREVHIAVLLTNGQVLAAGGYDDAGGGDTASAELYDPSSQTWTRDRLDALRRGHAGGGAAHQWHRAGVRRLIQRRHLFPAPPSTIPSAKPGRTRLP